MTVDLILEISRVGNFVNYYYLLFLIDHTVSFTARRPLSVVNIALVSGYCQYKHVIIFQLFSKIYMLQ